MNIYIDCTLTQHKMNITNYEIVECIRKCILKNFEKHYSWYQCPNMINDQ